MELVYGEGLLRQEKQSFLSILASRSFQALYARLVLLYPGFPFVNCAVNTVYHLAAETNSVHLLKQQTLEGRSLLMVVFPLEILVNPLDVALQTLNFLVTPDGRCCAIKGNSSQRGLSRLNPALVD